MAFLRLFLVFLCLATAASAQTVTVNNFNANGATDRFESITHYAVDGTTIDAHDGMVLQVGNTFYLYGTAYACGFQWQVTGSWCGFNIYSSPDRVVWTYVGQPFDSTTPFWQTACATGTVGCFELRVLYNAANNNYVMWFNVPNSGSFPQQYAVYVCSTPVSGCVLQAAPSHMQVAGTSSGEALAVDASGVAYIAYNALSGRGLYVDQLNSAYTDSTGAGVGPLQTNVEQPAMFIAAGYSYILYGNPCAYCTGTPTYYVSASSPLGTYGSPTTLNANSCFGQPGSVDTVTSGSTTTYVYRVDQWNGNNNETVANMYYQPLTYSAGVVTPFSCATTVTFAVPNTPGTTPPIVTGSPDQSDYCDCYLSFNDVTATAWRLQTFVPTVSTLGKIILQLSQYAASGNMTVNLVTVDGSNNPVTTLWTQTISASGLAWNTSPVTLLPNLSGLTPGTTYGLEIEGSASGTVGTSIFLGPTSTYPAGVQRLSTDSGATWSTQANRAIMFATYPIAPPTALKLNWFVHP